jgi:hypothetical protein
VSREREMVASKEEQETQPEHTDPHIHVHKDTDTHTTNIHEDAREDKHID